MTKASRRNPLPDFVVIGGPDVDFWTACRLRPEILGDGECFRCLAPWRRLFPTERLHLLGAR